MSSRSFRMHARRAGFWLPALLVLALLLALSTKRSAGARSEPSHSLIAPRVRPARAAQAKPNLAPQLEARAVLPAPKSSGSSSLPRQEPVAPLTALVEGDQQTNRALYEAEELMVASCMTARGFDYVTTPFSDETEQTEPDWLGSDRVTSASRSGYGIVDTIERNSGPRPFDANEQHLQSLTPAARASWEEALQGPERPPPDLNRPNADPEVTVLSLPSGISMSWNNRSCLTLGRRTLYGDELEYTRVELEMASLRQKAHALALTDDSYLVALERWQSCMQGQGMNYERPQDPSPALLQAYRDGKYDLEQLRLAEVDAATADANCSQTTGLTDAFLAARARREQELSEGNAALVEQFETLRRAALELANGRLAAPNVR